MYELKASESPRLPCPLVDDPDFKYYCAADTDVTRTWRKNGWKPLAELKGETK